MIKLLENISHANAYRDAEKKSAMISMNNKTQY
jgi:hypothetical protein